MNRFGYIEPRNVEPWVASHAVEPGNVDPVTLSEPKVPITAGEKRIAEAQRQVVLEAASLGQPEPPVKPPVRWPQTLAQAPAITTITSWASSRAQAKGAGA